MTIDDETIGETDLLAYVDGHLDPARARLVERHLARDGAAARRVAADQAINDGLRRLFDPVYHEELPPRLRTALGARPRRPAWARTLTRAAAALALLAGGAAAGWHFSDREPRHAEFTGVERFAEGPLQPVAFGGGKTPQEPAAWLERSVGEVVRVPDLGAAGMTLVGQALVGTEHRPAVQLTYEDERGRRVYLFMQARADDVGPRTRTRDDGRRGVVYWAEGPLMFAVTGDAAPEDLRIIAEMVTQAEPSPAATQPSREAGLMPAVGGSLAR